MPGTRNLYYFYNIHFPCYMKLRYLAYTLIISIAMLLKMGAGNVMAQPGFCPPNLDFEQGNLSNWSFYTGTCCPINAANSTAPLGNRHVLMSGAGIDTYGRFPVVAPGGGSYSLKLGNDFWQAQAERARYFIRVPNTPGDYIFLYRYAVVFQDPVHQPQYQPRFEVKAFDSLTNDTITCNQFTYVSSSVLPGFYRSVVDTTVFFKPWTTATIDLSGYNGRTVAIDFASGDCGLGAHFGYGYVDMQCGLFQVRGVSCNGDTTYTLNAPPGYQYYKWMDSTLTQTVGTTQTVVVPKTTAHPKYAIIVSPYQGFGCADTFFTTYVEDTASITAWASPDTAICRGKTVQLKPHVNSNNKPYGFNWYPAGGLSCTTCEQPYATPSDTTEYHVVVNDAYGCKDTATVRVDVWPKPDVYAGIDTGACMSDSVLLTGAGNGATYAWYPLTNLTGANTLTPKAAVTANRIYNLIMTSQYGCKDTDDVQVMLYPPVVANAGADKQACILDSVTLSGSAPQAVSFTWYPSAGLSSPIVYTPRAVVTSITQYYLAVANAYGCRDTDMVQIIPYPQPTVWAGNDTTVCKGEIYKMYSYVGGGSSVNYSWTPAGHVFTPNQPYPNVIADTERTYKLVVTTNRGCSDSDEVKVSTYPKPIANAGPDTGTCRGTPVKLQGSGGITYAWYPHTIVSPQNHAITWASVPNSRTFYLVVGNAYNCKDTDEVYVTLYPDPIADAGPDTGACLLQEAQLQGGGGISYLWTPPSGLSNPTVSNPRTTVTANNTYILTVANEYGCKDNDTVDVSLYPFPVANAGADTAFCRGSRSFLNGSGGILYQWLPAWAVSNASVPYPMIITDSTTTFTLVVTDINGCKDTDDVVVTVNPVPLANAGPDTAACIGDEVRLYATGGGAYLWSPAGQLNDPASATPTATVATTTGYLLRVTNSFGCNDYDTVVVTAHPKPDAFAGPDTTVCPGAAIDLWSGGGVTYKWSPPQGLSDIFSPAPEATVSANISYRLEVTNEYGCKDSTVINIDTIPLLFKVEPPGSICKGEELHLQASGADYYLWHPGYLLDDSTKANPIAGLDETTEFKLVMRELTCNRADSYYVTAIVHSLPQLKVAANDKDCGLEYGMLTAQGAVAYHWTPEEGLEDPYAAMTKARPATTTWYTLTATDEKGCTDTASVELRVFDGEGRLYIPDAFTPNGDGVNDCYRVFVPGDVTEFQFSVYNRFGERVFHATDRSHCWDGTYKGEPAELSTYFYYYEATSSVCGKVFRKGDMHLIR